MKKIYKSVLLAALGLGGVTAAQAQINNNDLVIGFTSQAAGVTDDYLVDLGQIPGTPNTSLNVSGFSISTFSSTFGSALSDGEVNVGIIGGQGSGPADVYLSILDGLSAPANAPTLSNIGNAAGVALGLSLGSVPQSGNGFYYAVAENPTTDGAEANSFASYLDVNPLTTIGGSETALLDLYEDAGSGRTGTTGWEYEGDVAIDLSGPSFTATWDPVIVPEPATFGVFAVGGLMVLAVRRYRQSGCKTS